jgi:hypothetical protein
MIKRKTVYIICVFVIIIILLPYIIIFSSNNGLSSNTEDWSNFGGYFGGILTPIVTIINVIILIGINNTVSNINNDYKEHIRRLKKIDKTNAAREYKIKYKKESTIEENINDIFKDYYNIKEILDLLEKSDNSCKKDLIELFDKIGVKKDNLNKIRYYENPFEQRNFEIHNLKCKNNMLDFNLHILQLKVNAYKILYEKDKTDENNNKYHNSMQELELFVKDAGYAD